ncbi:MAG: hypothetical protein ACO1SV_03425 [Fimbriimonas sp.]
MRRFLIIAAIACGACASNGPGSVPASQDDSANPPKLDLPPGVKEK